MTSPTPPNTNRLDDSHTSSVWRRVQDDAEVVPRSTAIGRARGADIRQSTIVAAARAGRAFVVEKPYHVPAASGTMASIQTPSPGWGLKMATGRVAAGRGWGRPSESARRPTR